MINLSLKHSWILFYKWKNSHKFDKGKILKSLKLGDGAKER